MRIIIFTGNGGAGVSTLAAATAAATAADLSRTLAYGVGPGLAAAFDKPLGPQPAAVGTGLRALEASPGGHEDPGPFLSWLRDLFAWRNMDESIADDVAALPGIVDLAHMLELEEHVSSGVYGTIVVDMPALRQALDLLAALDAAVRALDRLLPERQPTAFDPFLRALGGAAASAGEAVYEDGRALLSRLSELRRAFADPETASIRLVFAPRREAVAQIQRAVTSLHLYGYPLDAAVCNMLLPDEAGDWSEGRRAAQAETLSYARSSLGELPVLQSTLAPRDVRGVDALRALAEHAYGERDAAAVLHRGPAQAFSRGDGSLEMSLALPFVRREELALERLDDAIIVHVGDRSRTIDLPPEARGLGGISSAFDGETLRVTFRAR